MIRFVGKEVSSILKNAVAPRNAVVTIQPIRTLYDGAKDTEEGFNAKYVAYFNRADIDHWEIRQAMNQIAGMDLIPDPSILCAAFRACRRLNDFALTVRILEMVKDKCGSKLNEIYPYILQEIRPTLDELGINTPEELGYDKPELALQKVYDIH